MPSHGHDVAVYERPGWTFASARSNAKRGKRKKAAAPAEPSSPHEASEDAAIPDGPYRAAFRRRGAELVRRVYEVDPSVV